MKKLLLSLSCAAVFGLVSQVGAQNSYTFTSAGATGTSGPSQAQVNAEYTGTNLQGAVTSSSGIQLWTVPSGGVYSIQAFGAQGGNVGAFTGGLGASAYGEIMLNGGDVLKIVVGQTGVGFGGSAGGGGGSYVALQTGNTPLVVAGGGSGATSNGPNGNPGLATNNGGAGNSCAGNGGTGGNGGGDAAACNNGAGGGGGFFTDGSSASSWGSQRGYGFVNGSAGGTSSSGGCVGGFGGGAGTHQNNTGGGAGGGYSGGGAPFHGNGYSGGGGGSYATGINTSLVSGVNTGNGSVIITALTSPAPNNAGANVFATPTFVNGMVCAGSTSIDLVIQNYGSNQINSVDIEWTFGGVPQPTVTYSSLLDTFGGVGNTFDTVNLGTVNITGDAEIVAWTFMPNGVMDTVNLNDTAFVSIDSVVTVELDLGPDKVSCDGNFIILDNTAPSNQAFNSYAWSTGAATSSIITNTPGTYSLSVTYGPPQCFAADQIVVTSAPFPVVDLGPDSTYCANDFVLDAGGDGATYNWSDGTSTQTNNVSVSGNYSVTVTSDDGCVSEDDINLTLLEQPVVDLGEDFKLCISYDQTRLLSAGNSFSSYLWSTGATTPNIVVGAGVTAVGNQTYSVTVTGANGCTGEDAVVAEYSMCVGVNENANNSNVSLFPNPATDLVTFLSEGTNITEVQIFDLTGKMVYNNLPTSDRLDVNTSEFASGTYIVKVITNNESVTRRLIVE